MRLLALVVAAAALLGTTVLPPLLFTTVLDWTCASGSDLSNASQAYGVISTILSLLALGGVICATVLQIQDQREGRLEGNRNLHFELMKFGIENPGYLAQGLGVATPPV